MGWLGVLAEGSPPLVSRSPHLSEASRRPVRSCGMPAADVELEKPESERVCPVLMALWRSASVAMRV